MKTRSRRDQLALELYRAWTLARNEAGRPEERLGLDAVDWENWWDQQATMPLSGPGFIMLWTGMADLMLATPFEIELGNQYMFTDPPPAQVIADGRAATIRDLCLRINDLTPTPH